MIHRVWIFSMRIPRLPAQVTELIRRVRSLGVSDVALMINSLEERSFNLAEGKRQALEETARQLRSQQVSLHLVTWLRPTAAYLGEAARQLRPLCERTGVRSLMFDVEEPWTLAPETRGSEAQARSIVERYWRFTNWPCPLGATGITFIPASVRPVAERCNYVLPQAYSVFQDSTSSVYYPGVTQRLAHARWRGFGKPIVMGLAGWNKLARPSGISENESMRRCLEATEALRDPPVYEVAYWVLEGLSTGSRFAFVRHAASRATGRPPGGTGPLPPAPPARPVLRRGARGPEVRGLQQRLGAVGFPLQVDGIFGPRTEQAVRAFQARAGLQVDGVVGPRTWARLAAPAGAPA